jgi:proteasome lid subunit RPN8/RPN11
MIWAIAILVRRCGVSQPKEKKPMSIIHLPKELIEQMKRAALDAYPEEFCGIITGNSGVENRKAKHFFLAPNTKEAERERRYLIDPLYFMEVEDAAETRGEEIMAIVHSHPDHPSRPSDFDRQNAWPGVSYIILSVSRGIVAQTQSWQLAEDRGQFTEERIDIVT